MAELADAQDLGSCAVRCAGSTPVTRTDKKESPTGVLFCQKDKIRGRSGAAMNDAPGERQNRA